MGKTDKTEIDVEPNFSIHPSKIKHVVFDWDNTLSSQAELGSEHRTLAFPETTQAIFAALKKQGISFTISSRHTTAEQIKSCFLEDSDYIIQCGIEKDTLLKELNTKDTLASEILLVDDSKNSRSIARKNGFQVIHADADSEGLYVANTQHLQRLIHILNIDTEVAQFALRSYLTKKRTQLENSIFILDQTRGIHRAEIYHYLLARADLNSFTKELILYRLLASSDGKTLQAEVAAALGYASIEEARAYYANSIADRLDVENFSATNHKIANHTIIELVRYANSNESFTEEKLNTLLAPLAELELARTIGLLDIDDTLILKNGPARQINYSLLEKLRAKNMVIRAFRNQNKVLEAI